MFTAIFALIVGMAALAPMAGATMDAASAATAPGRLLAFGALDERSAWVLTDGALLLSDDGGASWREITPSTLAADRLTAVAFLDAQTGWTAHIDESQPGAVVLAATTDGGHTWQTSEHRLPPIDDPAARPNRISIFWLDATHGWLMLRQATSSNFNHGALFRTQDGGQSWRQVAAPGGHPVVFVAPSTGWTAGGPNGDTLFRSDDGGASWRVQSLPYPDEAAPGQRQHLAPRFSADGQQGVVEVVTLTLTNQRRDRYMTHDGGDTWAFVENAAPTAADRWRLDTATNSLLRTDDDGRTWQSVLVGAALSMRPATIERAVSAAAVAGSPDARTARFNGHGFDMCELGGEENLRRWIEASPYRAVNLYIGGALRACANNALDALLLEALSVQGWTFIPTWVGPQAPCTRFRERFDVDPTAAFSQGRAEAEKALQRARELGLAETDGSGTVIYYNLEAYDGQDAACVEASRAFVAGWTQRIHESSSYAGLYALACNPPIARYADLPSPPDAVWFAAWNRTSFDPTMTVWDISSTCLPPTLWINQQRIRQYTGSHNETWGDVTFEIDSNVLESIVADLSGVVEPPVTVIVETPTLSPAFDEATACADGWHRFTNVRGYPTHLAVSQPLGATIPPLNYGVWRPRLPVTGTYRVEALIVSHGAAEFPCRGVTLGPDTRRARYIIYHHAGATTTERDQLPLNDAWLRLGSYPFAASEDGFVYLDAAVADHPRLVSFSAMRFTLEFEGLLENRLYLPVVQQ
jgi:photosystem II stability/assembly factor-like uncharacterized protein